MAYGQIDPARLNGDDLTQWYLRSPDDIEQERQDAAAQRYRDFFGGNGGAEQDPGFDAGFETPTQDLNPRFNGRYEAPARDTDPGFNWVPVGPNRWRSTEARSSDMSSVPGTGGPALADAGTLDRRGAGLGDGGELLLTSDSGLRPRASVAALSTPSSAVAAPRATPGESPPTYRGPATPPLPTFFSSLFGGPVPITSPEGNVVGYYDHQAAKAGLGLTAEYAQVAPLFQPGGWMDGLLENGGSRIASAISDGIEEAVENHHALPKFMGGAADQETIALRKSLHRGVHAVLHPALKDAGLLNVGGKGGATADWLRYFDEVPGSREKAFQVLRNVYGEFDRIHGTAIAKHLEKVLADYKPPGT